MSLGVLLSPLGFATGSAAALRRAAHVSGLLRSKRLGRPVISVGNLSVGGTGKTPLVAWLAQRLADSGRKVAVLSRGHGGWFRGECLIVSSGEGARVSALEAGDEPTLLANALPGVVVAVGARRDVAGAIVERRFSPDLFLLDDGFQHLRLARDLDLVCVRPEDVFARPLPAGRLREWPSALRAAGLAVLSTEPASNADAPAERRALAWLGALVGSDRVVVARRRTLGFFDLSGQPAAAPHRPFLLAGIARPGRFAADIRRASGEPAGARFFRDHHRFEEAELGRVGQAASAAFADAVVTTEKDLVRISAAGLLGAIGRLPLLTLRIGVELDDESRLLDPILRLLGERSQADAESPSGPRPVS